MSGKVDSVALQKLLDRCWTIQDLSELFGVTGMTIHNWRNYRDLPAVVISGYSRPALRFVPEDVIAWAQANDQPMLRVRLPSKAA